MHLTIIIYLHISIGIFNIRKEQHLRKNMFAEGDHSECLSNGAACNPYFHMCYERHRVCQYDTVLADPQLAEVLTPCRTGEHIGLQCG